MVPPAVSRDSRGFPPVFRRGVARFGHAGESVEGPNATPPKLSVTLMRAKLRARVIFSRSPVSARFACVSGCALFRTRLAAVVKSYRIRTMSDIGAALGPFSGTPLWKRGPQQDSAPERPGRRQGAFARVPITA